MKHLFSLLCLLITLLVANVFTGCSTTGASSSTTASGTTTASSVVTDLENFVWTAANAYEAANTGGVLTQTIASTILSATKSDPTTTAEVLAATSLADKVAQAGIAAHNAGATPQGVTNTQTALLADPGVISSTASAAASQASTIDHRNRALVAEGKPPLPVTKEDIAIVVGKIRPMWHPVVAVNL